MAKANKKGFTLLEMMLSIAIIVLVSGLFVSLILATKDSYYRTYNRNDSTDYAALYSQALENQILRDWQMMPTISEGEVCYGITRDGTSALGREVGSSFTSPTPIFNLSQMTNKDGNIKWEIYIGNVSWDDTNNKLTYTIYIVDNYLNPGSLQSTYTSTIWLPVHENEFSTQNKVTFTTSSSGRQPADGLIPAENVLIHMSAA